MSLYLDYNASAPIDPRVLDVMIDVYRNSIGNADSRTHGFGENARGIVENARHQVAQLLGVNTDEVFFTSGATESNNIAIQGLRDYALKTGRTHIITSSIEHKAVFETVKAMEAVGFETTFVDPNRLGRIDADQLIAKIKPNTLMVSLMHVNNETGVIQPIKEVGEFCTQNNVFFHIDATQSCGKLVDEICEAKYDMLSFSAHKMGGPQGIGVLILRKKRYKLPPVKPIYHGGQQEHGIRPGTIPVALVAGCGKACELMMGEYRANAEKCTQLKSMILKLLEDSGLPYMINGDPKHCMANTINICIHGVSSEALMLATKDYCSVSNGSACTSKSYAPSYVLHAMGMSVEDIESSFRVSWGSNTDTRELLSSFSQLLLVAKGMI